MPAKIDVLAIEIAENLVLSDQLSEPLQLRYQEILNRVVDFIKKIA
jgi:hypothetical protein